MRRFELEESPFTRGLGAIRMGCDQPLTQRKIKVMPNKSFSMAITGKPGSGKSSFMLSLLSRAPKREDSIYYRVFADITYCCPPDSRASAIDSPLADLPPDAVFDNLDYAVEDRINDIHKKYMEDPSKKRCQLLIVDDLGQRLKTKAVQDLLTNLMYNRRHKALSIILLTQYTYSIPKQIRSVLSHVVLFKPSLQDHSTIQKEYLEVDNQTWQHLSRFVFKEPHDTLFIDRDAGTYYKNLQRIHMS